MDFTEKNLSSQKSLCDVVGPICESGDYFAKDRMLPEVSQNDLLAITCSGAYGAVMASNYNSRPLISEVLVSNDVFSVIRERQTFEKIIQDEKLAAWLQ
jgi:diaminopimelate decarboxylase